MNKFPRNMLFSRAISNGARWHCPDIFGGAPVYTAEELGADVDENGDVLQVTESPKHYATEYADFVDVETIEPRRIQEQRLDTLPDAHWTETPPDSPAAALNTIMENVPRYSGNKNAAVNVVKKFLPDGKEWTSLSKAERVELLKAVEAHAAKRDKEEATPKPTAAQEILKGIDRKELDHVEGGLPHYD